MSLEFWWTIPVGIVVVYFGIAALIVVLGSAILSSPFREITVDLEKLMLESFSTENCRWIMDHSLTIRGSYSNSMATLHVFALPDEETELALISMNDKNHLGFQTKLTDDRYLETGNNSDSEAVPPPPSVYRQTMMVSTLEELYQHHTEGLDFLAKTKKLNPVKMVPQEELLLEIKRGVQKELNGVLLNPKVIVLLPYLFVTKRKRINHTIAKQFGQTARFYSPGGRN